MNDSTLPLENTEAQRREIAHHILSVFQKATGQPNTALQHLLDRYVAGALSRLELMTEMAKPSEQA